MFNNKIVTELVDSDRELIHELRRLIIMFADSIAKLDADVKALIAANATAAATAVAAKDAQDAAAVDAIDAEVVAALPAPPAPTPAPAA